MTTKMLQETLESGSVLKKQWAKNHSQRLNIAEHWKAFNPYSFLTIARGSSDHAAQYFNYLASLKLGKLTTSLTPSLISLHKTQLDCSKSVAIAISQSGKSPDLISCIENFSHRNYESVALVNDPSSPLASISKYIFPLHAGPEISVAATKSFIASLYASASLIAQASDDQNLLKALPNIDNSLVAKENSWAPIVDVLKETKQAMIVGRGLGFSIALEAALKLKETCHIQAEAFSAAEILHGPQAVIETGYALIVFALRGPTQKGLIDLGMQMRNRGARVIIISDHKVSPQDCTYQVSEHSDLDPLCAIHNFYLMVEELARVRGLDPDNPRSLSKVTKTL